MDEKALMCMNGSSSKHDRTYMENATGHQCKGPSAALRTILVSGPVHSGKSTLAETVVDALRRRGVRVAGILARGLWKDGLRAGFDLVDLSSGDCTPLARRRRQLHPGHGMMFDFLEPGIRAGSAALSPDTCRRADIVVVDELGRLEACGKGWAPSLIKLLMLDGPLLLLVARWDRLPQIRALFGLQNAPLIDVGDPCAYEQLRAAIDAGLNRSTASSCARQ